MHELTKNVQSYQNLSITLEICTNISKVTCVFNALNVLWLVVYRKMSLQIQDIHRKVISQCS